MKEQKTYIILRLSSLSNVAMLAPVVAGVSRANPDDRFIVVALKPLSALFYGLGNVEYCEVKDDVKHLRGLWNLSKLLAAYKPTMLFDLQGDCRTYVLRLLMRRYHVPAVTIRSVAREQRALLRSGYALGLPLKPEAERYRETLLAGGLRTADSISLMPVNHEAATKVEQVFGSKRGRWIGIAPFAKYQSNMLPYKTMKEVIAYFAEQPDTRVFLFGAGHVETEMLRQWSSLWPSVESVTNHLALDGELELMRKIDGLLCMDSANQHLAALVGCKMLSIWCGTHPKTGYAAKGLNTADILSLPVSCRPCSVHGTNRCKYRNFACKALTSEMITERFEKLLHSEI